MLWSLFTVIAAFSQALRNAQQKRLSGEIDALGVTLARFLWAPPLAFGYLGLLYALDPAPLPDFGLGFVLPASAGALAQIVATVLMVQLFQRRSYTAGVGLAKSEALFALLPSRHWLRERVGGRERLGLLLVALGALLVLWPSLAAHL